MIRIVIKDPIGWHEKCTWIENNCNGYIDDTEWAAWQIGITDIYFWLEEDDATIFRLVWG